MSTLRLTIDSSDASEVDRLSRQLRTELLSLGPSFIDLVGDDSEHPRSEGAKGDLPTITTIVVTLSGSPVLVQLGRVLRDWVNRANGRKIIVREGDRSLEIVGNVSHETGRLIDNFFHEAGAADDPDGRPDA